LRPWPTGCRWWRRGTARFPEIIARTGRGTPGAAEGPEALADARSITLLRDRHRRPRSETPGAAGVRARTTRWNHMATAGRASTRSPSPRADCVPSLKALRHGSRPGCRSSTTCRLRLSAATRRHHGTVRVRQETLLYMLGALRAAVRWPVTLETGVAPFDLNERRPGRRFARPACRLRVLVQDHPVAARSSRPWTTCWRPTLVSRTPTQRPGRALERARGCLNAVGLGSRARAPAGELVGPASGSVWRSPGAADSATVAAPV